MKRLSKIIVLAAALHMALPIQAAGAGQNPIPVSSSWTSGQILLLSVTAGAALLSLCSLYSWLNKPSRVSERFTVMSAESRGNPCFDCFLEELQTMQAQIDVLQPIDIRHIRAAEKCHGVLFGFSKGRYQSESDAYIVRMDNSSGFIELSCSNIPALSLQIQSALKGFGVLNVRQGEIEAFLTRKFNSQED